MSDLNQFKGIRYQINSKINWLFGAVFAVGASILAALFLRYFY